jgi:hypothetical protein
MLQMPWMGHSLWRWIALLLALAPCRSPSWAADATAGHTRAARIYLQVNAANGEPVTGLSAAHFALMADQRRLTFTIANSTPPRHSRASVVRTHLLVVPGPFLQGVRRPCEQLAAALRAKWKVQLLDSSGALRTDSTCGGAIQVVHASEQQALETLEAADGRRVLLYVTTVNRSLSHTAQQRAANAGITMYDVGGREPYFIEIRQHSPASTTADRPQVTAAVVETTSLGAVKIVQPALARPESSIDAALQHATRDAGGAYVLTTRLAGAIDLLSVKLRQIQPGWTVVARVAVDHGPAPRLEITQ